MATFKIPKGNVFGFSVRVVEPNSFLPQDLTDLDVASFKIFEKANGNALVLSSVLTTDDGNGSEVSQVDEVTVASVVDDTEYTISILYVEGTSVLTADYLFVSGTGTTEELIIAGLATAMANAPVTPTTTATTLTLTGADSLTTYSYSISSNLVLDNTVEAYTAVSDSLNGLLTGTLGAGADMVVDTTGMLQIDRGSKVDNFYLKALYYASIDISFTDPTILPITVLIEDVYVTPTAVA